MSDTISLRPQQFRKLLAGRIDPHPLNFRLHTDRQQSALSGILAEIGFIGSLIVRPYGEDEDGQRYQCLDGHERLSRFASDDVVPCFVVKLSDEEAAKFLATFDAVTSLAKTDVDLLKELTADIEWDQEGLDALIADTLNDANQLIADAFKSLDGGADDDTDDPPDQPQSKHQEQEAPNQTDELTELWQVLVTCEDEADQRSMLAQFKEQGRSAKALNTL